MAKLVCVIPGKELSNPDRDFRSAVRVEQYRISGEALFIPEGFHWKYYPLSAVDKAEESFRVISAGHCVPVVPAGSTGAGGPVHVHHPADPEKCEAAAGKRNLYADNPLCY